MLRHILAHVVSVPVQCSDAARGRRYGHVFARATPDTEPEVLQSVAAHGR